MTTWLQTVLPAVGTLIVTLTVTLLFNKLVNIPTLVKAQKAKADAEMQKLREENAARDRKIANLETAINALPSYRTQSLQIQNELKDADLTILAACQAIKDGVKENQDVLNARLDRLEKREKNAIRAKLLDEYRLFTDSSKNPMLAWSEMEHHAFFELLHDYEDLNGNDYVHSVVIPAMNALHVIAMSDKQSLLELMNSRKL